NSLLTGVTSLTNVTMPDRLTSIGSGAFAYCAGLTNVTIPNRVRSIRDEAFFGSGLTSVTIPDSVTSIESGAFAGCTGLKAIQVGAPNPVYSSVGGVLFNKAATALL